MFSAEKINQFRSLETPFYYYDLKLLQRTLETCKTAAEQYDFHIHYALKANFNDPVLSAIKETGFGADCVSGNEVKKAIEIGFSPDKVVFAGVGKSDREIEDALAKEIFCFNVESLQELTVLNSLAEAKGKNVQIALRINPNVDAHTHHNITTGLEENKFGINIWELGDCISLLKDLKHIKLIGIHFHIGSQITNLEVFKSLCIKVNELNTWFTDRGHDLDILNVGGGLGVDYFHPDENAVPDFAAYFKIFDQFLHRRPNQQIHFELGRALVAQCSSLISRVLYVKNGLKKNFLILDAGMTELMRPALYQAYHKIENLTADSKESSHTYDIVGPICESTDKFAVELAFPQSKRGDLIAIRTTGAYGEVMASGYNLRDKIVAVY